jgi:ABC-type proline/glycine betaine transport system permease subunit
MQIADVLEHFFVSIIGWSLGATLGIALGYWLYQKYFKNRDDCTNPVFFRSIIPWRTILAMLILMNLFPYLLVSMEGAGIKTGLASVSWIILICSAPVTVQLAQLANSQITAISFLLSLIRSFLVLSPIIGTYYGMWGGGGLGFYLYQSLVLRRFDDALFIFLAITAGILAIDILAGIIEYLARRGIFKREPLHEPV